MITPVINSPRLCRRALAGTRAPVALDLADSHPATGALAVRHAKGWKERCVYVKGGGVVAMTAWLERRGTDPGALFFAVDQSGRVRRTAFMAM